MHVEIRFRPTEAVLCREVLVFRCSHLSVVSLCLDVFLLARFPLPPYLRRILLAAPALLETVGSLAEFDVSLILKQRLATCS